jgi:acyl carrier protein
MIILDVKETILGFFREKGITDALDYDTDLFSGGYVNSLFALEIILFIEETFSIRIPDKDISESNFKTIESIALEVEKNGGGMS